jgi:hypothetical protein
LVYYHKRPFGFASEELVTSSATSTQMKKVYKRGLGLS